MDDPSNNLRPKAKRSGVNDNLDWCEVHAIVCLLPRLSARPFAAVNVRTVGHLLHLLRDLGHALRRGLRTPNAENNQLVLLQKGKTVSTGK